MRNLKTLIFGVCCCFLMSVGASAKVFNNKECQFLVNNVNKNLPEQVDTVTWLINSTCLVHGGKAEFTYVYHIDTKRISVKSLPNSFAKRTIRGFCTNPDSRVFLNGVTKMRMDYYDKASGDFFGRIEFNQSDC